MIAGIELAADLRPSTAAIAGAEMAMARSLVLYRRGQARVATANACCISHGFHVRQGHDALANDEFGEAAMLIRSCPDPGPRIQRLL